MQEKPRKLLQVGRSARVVALHSNFFLKVSASGFQSFGEQTLHVERSGAAFYMHSLFCWVVGRHLQVFWEFNWFAVCLFSMAVSL